jgi:hypothetical protein
LGHAGYVLPNNLIGSLSYNIEYGKHFGTTISLFYRGANSGRASYTYSNNLVNDGAAQNLIYVPRNPSEITFVNRTVGTGANAVTWTAQQQSDAFFAYIEQCRYLRSRKGQYAERGGIVLPWAHHFDIKILQDFFINAGGRRHTFQVGLDIMNVGNLLNSAWGNRWAVNQAGLLFVQNLNDVTNPNILAEPRFQLNPIAGSNDIPTESFRKVVGLSSTYWMQLSLRYIF